MLICPTCKTQYGKKKLFGKNPKSCEKCDVDLLNVLAFEELKVHTIKSPYGDREKWAKSTIPATHDPEDLVEVYQVSKNKLYNPYPRERMWLHDILDDKEIPYRVEISGEFRIKAGGFRRGRSISETQHIFVEKANEKKAKILIKGFKRSKAAEPEDAEQFEFDEYAEYDSDEYTYDCDSIPQVKCPHCSEECDCDYEKCPHCKKKLYG